MIRDDHTEFVDNSRLKNITAEIDKWFVGSSRNRMSGCANKAAASAVRTRHPPLSAFIGLAMRASENPRFFSSTLTRAGALADPMASSMPLTSCKRATASASSLDSNFICSSRSNHRCRSARKTTSPGSISSSSAVSSTSCVT